MSVTESPAELFGEHYFRHSCGPAYERSAHWLSFFGGIGEHIVRRIGPRSVLDAGCAMGFLVEALRDRGVEAFGLDVSEYALQRVRDDLKPYCWLGSVLDPLPRSYDLIVCIEVLEHLPQADSERALENLCRSCEDLLFSSTPEDYREATHLNVQPPEYWAEQFALQGFVHDVEFDGSFITPWAARFRRSQEPHHRVLRNYERWYWLQRRQTQELRQAVGEMRRELAKGERLAGALREQVAEREETLRRITEGPGWQLLQVLGPLRQTLAPTGSWRDRWLMRALRRIARRASR